jgi:hypothetical protein
MYFGDRSSFHSNGVLSLVASVKLGVFLACFHWAKGAKSAVDCWKLLTTIVKLDETMELV